MTVNFQRYQRGGDFYANVAANYGAAAADSVAAAAATGDETALNFALSNARQNTSGGALNASTASIFLDQIRNDPLAAPLESANRVLGNSLFSLLRNPFVLLLAALLVAWKLGLLSNLTKGAK